MSTGFDRIRNDAELQDHWLRRLLAFVIDSVIVSAFIFVIAVIVSIPYIIIGAITGLPAYLFNPFAFPFFTGICSLLYFAFSESIYGTTLGKRIMNLKTTTLDGQKPTLSMAFLRNATKIYWIAILIDTLVGLATVGDPHQRATDRAAGTIVVASGASPFPRVTVAQPAVRLCSNCGQKIAADVKYCPYCGKEQA